MINNTNQNGQSQIFLGPALKALERGVSVLPLGRDKKALLPWKEYQAKAPERPVVESWARQWPDANLGIVTGEISNLTVIDCDSEEARRRLDEHLVGLAVPEVKTPKGYHLYFRHRPGLKNGVGVLPSTDIRNDGGYVVAPPSKNGEGVSYKWIAKGNGALPEIPEALFNLLTSKPTPSPQDTGPTSGNGSPYGRKALEDEARKVAEAIEPGRNNQLNISAVKLGKLVAGGVLEYSEVEASLLHAAQACGLNERDAKATIKSGLSKGMTEPRTPPENEHYSSHYGGDGRKQERTEPPGPDEWESPIPIGSKRPGPMPQDLLPGPVGEMVVDLSAFSETPYEMPAGIALGVVAACIQGKAVVQVKPGYSEPLQVFVMPALDSGCRKTSVVEALSAPIVEWEAEKAREMEPEIRRVAAKNKAVEARIAKLNGEYAKEPDDNILKEIEALMADKEPTLVAPRIFCQDVTVERLGSLMGEHNGRMSIICDEGGFFDILAGRYSSGAPNLDLFLKGHAGSAIRVDRGSRDPVWIDAPALTLAMSPQPETIFKLAKMPGFRGRGVLARFWYLMPESTLGFRTLTGPPIPGDVSERYRRFIRGLLEIPTPDDGPERIPLAKAAYAEWFEFSLHIESGLKPGGDFELIKDWCGKLPGAAARMAGLIHIMDPTSGHEIAKETMGRALELASVFLEHALFVFDAMGADDGLNVARKIMSWAERNGDAKFKKRDCFNALRGSYPTMDLIEAGFKILVERHHIFVESVQHSDTPRRPSAVCTVNPAILKEWMS